MKSEIDAVIGGSVVNKSSSSISEFKAYQKPNQPKQNTTKEDVKSVW